MLKISLSLLDFLQKMIAMMDHRIQSFSRQESGATAVEYSLIVALIGIVIAAAAKILGNDITDLFEKASCAVRGGTLTAGVCSIPAP